MTPTAKNWSERIQPRERRPTEQRAARRHLLPRSLLVLLVVSAYVAAMSKAQLPSLNGVQHTYYCGSYFGYGLHEEAIVSALEVVHQLGVEPWF